MESAFINYIFLFLVIAFLVTAADRIRIAYPIVLVLGGLLLSLLQVLPPVTIEPETIFIVFLPPILYEAAWQTSWKDFWKWRRIIFSLAFFIVLLTALLIAFVSSNLIPGFTLALGFLLGGIVSPPDAVSATTIMKNVEVPKRISAVIEGESLLNDASSIIVFRFALAAVITGNFVFKTAAISFFLVIIMGAFIGIAIAFIFYALHRWLPTSSAVDLLITFVTPYIMYIAAEHFHFSGVLAVVSGGLLLSRLRQSMLSPLSRIQGVNVWAIIVFVLNGLIFLLIGLQLPLIVRGLGNTSLLQAIKYGLLVSAVLIVSRLLIAFGITFFTMFVSRFIKTADSRPGFRAPLIVGWAGMRGVVSLAAALSIPLYIGDNVPFPQRNLILFITFMVILVTLVLQGLTLPYIVRLARPEDPDYKVPDSEQEVLLQQKLGKEGLRIIEEKYSDRVRENELLQILTSRLQHNKVLLRHMHQSRTTQQESEALKEYEMIHLDIIAAQRNLLQQLNKKDSISDDVVKKYMLALDQEEEQLRNQIRLF